MQLSRASIAACSALVAAQAALAEIPAEVSSSQLETKRFSLSTTVSANSSLHEVGHIDRESSLDVLLSPSYRLSDFLTLNGSLSIRQNFEHERVTEISNTKLSLSVPAITLNPFMRLTPVLASTIATHYEAIKKDSLVGALHLQPSLSISFAQIGLPALTIIERVSLTRNIHTYETSRTGASNTRYSIGNTVTAAYSFNDRLSLSATFNRAIGFTYGGAAKNNFLLSQALEYSVSDGWSVAAGHVNEGSAFKENGIDSNLSLFNPNASSVFGSVTFAY